MNSRFLKNDTVLRLLSVLIAVGLWIYVVQVQNPEADKSIINIPIVFSGQEAMTQNQLCFVGDQKQTVTVKIRGKRNNLAYINPSNVTAIVDVSGYSAPGTYPVPINVIFPVDGIEILEKKPYTYIMEVDNMGTKTLPITVNLKGTPKENYMVGEPVLSNADIIVTGPESIIKTVSKAVVAVDVSGKDRELTSKEKVVLYDSNNTVLTNSQFKLNVEEVAVVCPILETKTVRVVPTIDSAYTAPEGKLLKVDSITPTEVKVAGDKMLLDNLKFIKTATISPTFENGVYSAEAEMHIDAGLTLENDIKTVKVKLTLADKMTKDINVTAFKLEGLHSGYKCMVETKSLAVSVTGDKDTLDAMSEDTLDAVLNLSGLTQGRHRVPVTFSDGVTVVGTYFADVVLSE